MPNLAHRNVKNDKKSDRAPQRRSKTRSRNQAKSDEKRPSGASKPTGKSEAFAKLGLNSEIVARLVQKEFFTPTDIQRELIPVVLDGKDCLGQAKTGTGKTAAFTLPMIELITPGKGIQGVVMAPTRELAEQVGEHIQMLSPKPGPRTLMVFGGRPIGTDLRKLAEPIDILVATPGRLLDLIQRKAVSLSKVKVAILDEVDRMLDIGFRDDILKIFRTINKDRQTVFVSATITPEISALSASFMKDPVQIKVSSDTLTVDKIQQDYVSVETRNKFNVLRTFIQDQKPEKAIIFLRTKRGVQSVVRRLREAGIRCAELHGDLAQNKRQKELMALKSGKVEALIATDLAARGLDVIEVTHVVNYDIPEDAAVYVHRIGRTARMGLDGHALTFVTPEQGKELTDIECLINNVLREVDSKTFEEVPNAYDHLHVGEKPESKVPPKPRRTDNRKNIAPSAKPPTKRTMGSLSSRQPRKRVW